MTLSENETNLNETVQRILGMIVRRRWWILIAACVVALASAGVLSRLPNKYTAEATLVLQTQVLQGYVLPANAMAGTEIVDAITRQVLSRRQLIGIIKEFNLYTGRNGKTPNDELRVEAMRKSLEIVPLDSRSPTDLSAFKIAFTTDDPRVAQAVATRLTQLFIDENLRAREKQAASTSNFLKEQLEATKQKLTEQEQRLKDFKTQHPGELAEQQTANLTAVTDLRMQLQSIRSNLTRAQDQRASLESSLGVLLVRLQSERAALLVRFTPQHPDVIKKDADIAKAEAALNALRSPQVGRELLSPSGLDQPELAQLIREVKSNNREVAELTGQEQRLRSELSQYQGKLSMAPAREQELAAISRDYDLTKQQYADLLSRGMQSQVATNLEQSRESLQFRLIDPPTFPYVPSGPKRLKIALGGLAGGIFFGLALGFLIEMKDTSFHSEKVLRASFALPLMVAVPTFLTPQEQRSRKKRIGLEFLTGGAMVVSVAVVELLVCGLV